MILRHTPSNRRKERAHPMHEGPQLTPTSTENHDQVPSGGASPRWSTGPGADEARLIPTALAGPAQQGQEACPIILPQIVIGRAVTPHIPALPSVLATAYHPTLVLTPLTNEGKGEDTGAHGPHPDEEDAAQIPAEPIAPPPPPTETGHTSGYPVISHSHPDASGTSSHDPVSLCASATAVESSSPAAFSHRAGERFLPLPAGALVRCRLRCSGGDAGWDG